MPVKKCVDCGTEFEGYGNAQRCDDCKVKHREKKQKEYRKRSYAKWYADPENKKHVKESTRKYYQEHKEFYKEYQRRYFQEHTKAKRKEWYEKNKEAIRAKQKVYREKYKRQRELAKLFNVFEIEVGGKKIKMYECPKLRFKAMKLPCGDRYECWLEPKCQLIPDGKEPVTFKDATTEKSWFQQSKVKPTFDEVEET